MKLPAAEQRGIFRARVLTKRRAALPRLFNAAKLAGNMTLSDLNAVKIGDPNARLKIKVQNLST